jgi:hypothetical protein
MRTITAIVSVLILLATASPVWAVLFEEGEVLDVTRKIIKLKTPEGKTFTFEVSEDLAKGKVDPQWKKHYPNKLKDIRCGQWIALNYTRQSGKRVCIRLRVVKQSTQPCPEPASPR